MLFIYRPHCYIGTGINRCVFWPAGKGQRELTVKFVHDAYISAAGVIFVQTPLTLLVGYQEGKQYVKYTTLVITN